MSTKEFLRKVLLSISGKRVGSSASLAPEELRNLQAVAKEHAHRFTSFEEMLHSHEFYDTWRLRIVPCMTLVFVQPEGRLYYWHDLSCSIWVLVGERYLVVAYHHFLVHVGEDTVGSMRKHMLEWHQVMNEAVSEDRKVAFQNDVEYAAKVDSSKGGIDVRIAKFGDWAGLFLWAIRGKVPVHHRQIPGTWPVSFQAEIDKLNPID